MKQTFRKVTMMSLLMEEKVVSIKKSIPKNPVRVWYPYSVTVDISQSGSLCPILEVKSMAFNQEAMEAFIKDLNELLTYMKENNIG